MVIIASDAAAAVHHQCGRPTFSVRVSGFIRARLTAAESLAEGFSVTGRHDIVQDWIDGGREIVEAAGNVVHLLVDLVVVRVFFAVDVEKSLSVERCPADEEANPYSHKHAEYVAARVAVIGLAVAAMDGALEVVGAASERSTTDADADTQVQQAQHRHGNDEENEGGHFVKGSLGRSILVEHSAKRRFRNQMVNSARILDGGVDDSGVNGER